MRERETKKYSILLKQRTSCTFSFSPENERSKAGDYLKLVVTQSPHLSDATGQDHTFGVHLLNRDTDKHTENRFINTSRQSNSIMQANIVIELMIILYYLYLVDP